MFLDSSLFFSSYTTPVAVTTTADSSLVDVTGAGSGNAPAMIGGKNISTGATYPIGIDLGASDGIAVPSVNVTVGTTFTAGGSATLTVSLLAAPAVSATNNTPGTYTTLSSTAAIPVASLVAGFSLNLPIPPIQLGTAEALPRFYKLNYAVATGPMTAGTLSAGVVINQPNIAEGSQFPGNFVV